MSSGCSGTALEAKVASALGLDTKFIYTCEKNPQAIKFMAQNSPKSLHNFTDVGDPARGGGHCTWHNGHCMCPDEVEDIYVAGYPCQPHSTQNHKRFKAGAVQAHHLYDIGDVVVNHLAVRTPRAFILENVPGLMLGNYDADGQAQGAEIDVLMEKIANIRSPLNHRERPFAAAPVLQDMRTWVDVSRVRIVA